MNILALSLVHAFSLCLLLGPLGGDTVRLRDMLDSAAKPQNSIAKVVLVYTVYHITDICFQRRLGVVRVFLDIPLLNASQEVGENVVWWATGVRIYETRLLPVLPKPRLLLASIVHRGSILPRDMVAAPSNDFRLRLYCCLHHIDVGIGVHHRTGFKEEW